MVLLLSVLTVGVATVANVEEVCVNQKLESVLETGTLGATVGFVPFKRVLMEVMFVAALIAKLDTRDPAPRTLLVELGAKLGVSGAKVVTMNLVELGVQVAALEVFCVASAPRAVLVELAVKLGVPGTNVVTMNLVELGDQEVALEVFCPLPVADA